MTKTLAWGGMARTLAWGVMGAGVAHLRPHLVIDSSPGAPVSARVVEEVAISMPSVST